MVMALLTSLQAKYAVKTAINCKTLGIHQIDDKDLLDHLLQTNQLLSVTLRITGSHTLGGQAFY